MGEPCKRAETILNLRIGSIEITIQRVLEEGGVELLRKWLQPKPEAENDITTPRKDSE